MIKEYKGMLIVEREECLLGFSLKQKEKFEWFINDLNTSIENVTKRKEEITSILKKYNLPIPNIIETCVDMKNERYGLQCYGYGGGYGTSMCRGCIYKDKDLIERKIKGLQELSKILSIA
ncbi:MAG: hypothetical protein QMD14_03455 [Candidatus Aenigmarchaeota archaeon]|nr:hypothetical protein [Candidatus Aenigmarchaeota archaeon]